MRKFLIEEIGNGWLLHAGEQRPFYYPSLELCLKQLEPHAKCKPKESHEPEFRKGSSQIDIEDFLREKEQ